MVVPPSAVMSLLEWCTKKMFKQSKDHTAFLRTWSFVNTTFHMVSGIVHQEVLPSCLFHVWQGQRVSSSASLLDDGLMHPLTLLARAVAPRSHRAFIQAIGLHNRLHRASKCQKSDDNDHQVRCGA